MIGAFPVSKRKTIMGFDYCKKEAFAISQDPGVVYRVKQT